MSNVPFPGGVEERVRAAREKRKSPKMLPLRQPGKKRGVHAKKPGTWKGTDSRKGGERPSIKVGREADQIEGFSRQKGTGGRKKKRKKKTQPNKTTEGMKRRRKFFQGGEKRVDNRGPLLAPGSEDWVRRRG